MAATYLINRMPMVVLGRKTPYEKLHGKAPDHDYLRVFGSLCFVADVRPNKENFNRRGSKCIFLRYFTSQKAYNLHDLKDKKVHVSRHVMFLEDKFPFKDSDVYSQHVSSSPSISIRNSYVSFDSPPLSSSFDSLPLDSTLSSLSKNL